MIISPWTEKRVSPESTDSLVKTGNAITECKKESSRISIQECLTAKGTIQIQPAYNCKIS